MKTRYRIQVIEKSVGLFIVGSKYLGVVDEEKIAERTQLKINRAFCALLIRRIKKDPYDEEAQQLFHVLTRIAPMLKD